MYIKMKTIILMKLLGTSNNKNCQPLNLTNEVVHIGLHPKLTLNNIMQKFAQVIDKAWSFRYVGKK